MTPTYPVRPAAQFPIPPTRATFLKPKSPMISLRDMRVMSNKLILTHSSDKNQRRVPITMEAIEAVLELTKERDELATTVDTYESMLSDLVGETVMLTIGRKNHKRFVECTVTEFHGTEGWELTSTDEDGEVYMVTFEDFIKGKVRLT